MPHRPRRVVPAGLVFGAAIGMSAFLLFTVQPLVGRLMLPVYGGAAAVWATVLLFFQLILLAGYGYAHLVATRLTPARGAALHVAVFTLALLSTALAPRDVGALHDPRQPTVLDLLRLLLVLIGPAAFALTTTTPLVSSWYARVRLTADPASDPRDPYWLYALSNGGSLAALLAYPLLVEPRIGLSAQRTGWIAGFAILAVLVTFAAVTQWVRTRPSAVTLSATMRGAVPAPAAPAAPAPPSRHLERGRWIALAAIPAGLLAAVTNQVVTDLASAPLLWVIPLALYLASFMVAFSARGRRALPAIQVAAPAALAVLWLPIGSAALWPTVPLLVTQYLAFAVAVTAIHGRLAEARPPAHRLTEFYLVQSAGGALGGAFVAIVAPLAFDGVWELPILVVAALGVLAWTAPPSTSRRPIRRALDGARRRTGVYLLVTLPLLAVMASSGSPGLVVAVGLVIVGCVLLTFGGDGRVLALTTTAILVVIMVALYPPALFRDRSFFGVAEVLRTEEATLLRHGTTIHGLEWTDPSRRVDPGSYYARSGPVGDIFEVWTDRPPGRIRVAGLGAGVLSAYARPEDELAFFEIDELIARVATDDSLFTYVAAASHKPEIRIGDGRLLLAQEPSDSLDMVVLDAFSSDSVPTHLITLEALRDADRALAQDGLLVAHVSNRYFRLGPPVARALELLGFRVVERVYGPTAEEAMDGAQPSHFIVATRDDDVAEQLLQRGWVQAVIAPDPLTDDFPDVTRYFRG